MEKITKRTPEDKKLNIITEDVNYFETGNASIWGNGDPDTIKIISEYKFKGTWLNLACGDGRYNDFLAKQADSVVIADADEGAISKLWHNTEPVYRHKLVPKVLNITKPLPFADETFDGVFSTGTIHLFSKTIINNIFDEIKRILKPNGELFIDFPANITRKTYDGKTLNFHKDEVKFKSTLEAKNYLSGILGEFDLNFYESSVVEDDQKADPPYILTCEFLIVIGRLKSLAV